MRFKEESMRKERRALLAVLIFALPLTVAPLTGASLPLDSQQKRSEEKYRERLAKEVRHQLVLLPYYSVFDNLAFKIDGDKVTLLGQVVRPVLKDDAESAVKSIEGVAAVVNNIEVLPLSPMDDQLRIAVYRAIYHDTVLFRYGESAVPSIHIIVKNGNVTLVGVVDNESDKNIAYIRASGVPNVFSVKNELTVAGK
jgi:hyperosmotically inducible periplasmic protein